MHVQPLASSPNLHLAPSVDLLGPCIEECYTCAEACILSAHVMMGESGAPDPDSCIGLTLACADICAATGALAGRQTGGHRKVLKLLVEDCAVACDLCAAPSRT